MKKGDVNVSMIMDITEVRLIEKALEVLRYSKESEKMTGTELLNLAELSSKFQTIKIEMEERKNTMKFKMYDNTIENLKQEVICLQALISKRDMTIRTLQKSNEILYHKNHELETILNIYEHRKMDNKRMSNDLISRQAVYDELFDICNEVKKWAQVANDNTVKNIIEAHKAILIEMKTRIAKLPSAQPEQVTQTNAPNTLNALDCISRKDAIDALEREKTYSTAYKDGYTQTDYFKQYNMGLTDGIKALNKLPSTQPEPKWIPVEYRPPEFGKEVLISHKGTVSIDWLTQSEGSAYFFMSGAGIADIDAWMPLPKRYERSEDEKIHQQC